MGRRVTAGSAIFLFCFGGSSAVAQDRVTYRIIDSKGKPVAEARLYAADYPIHLTAASPLGGAAEFMGRADSQGRVRGYKLPSGGHVPHFLLALSNRGGLAVAPLSARKIVFGPSADLRLHFIDGHGRPIANSGVEIFPTDETFPVKGYGIDRIGTQLPPKLASRLCGYTDRRGNILFRRLPKGQPFFVNLSANDDMLDPVALCGAVYPGNPVAISVPLDLQITGRVVQASTGKPVDGVQIYIRFLGTADQGYNRIVTTNKIGVFRITGLPACEFHVRVGKPYDEEPVWIEVGDHSNIGRNDLIALKNNSVHCDIKVVRASTVTICAVDASGEPVPNWKAGDCELLEPEEDASSICFDSIPAVFYGLEPGRHRFAIGNRQMGCVLLKTIDIREGASINLSIIVPTAHPGG